MKRIATVVLVVAMLFSNLIFNISAISNEDFVPYVTDFDLTTETTNLEIEENSNRATGLINIYSLSLSKTGTTLNISGQTLGANSVVKSGFKDLTIQRRKSSSDSWDDYYEYGNVYVDAIAASLLTTLVVESGYQYRISCKHYAKKNLLSVQTIANTSNIVIL